MAINRKVVIWTGVGLLIASLLFVFKGELITMEKLIQIMPRLAADPVTAARYASLLNDAMNEFQINTPGRQAAFLAQIAFESNQLKWFEEIWGPTAAQLGYEFRTDLGNIPGTGDGYRFRGRGPIQLTGRDNYQAAGDALGLDLVNDPDQAATPEVGFRTAGWFWQTHGLNELADVGDFVTITRRINGGTNGLTQRENYWASAKDALGVGVA